MLWDILVSIFWFMLLFAWIWLLVMIFSDLFRDHELSGWAKAAWGALPRRPAVAGGAGLSDRPGSVDE
jgi:hypothetical protein